MNHDIENHLVIDEANIYEGRKPRLGFEIDPDGKPVAVIKTVPLTAEERAEIYAQHQLTKKAVDKIETNLMESLNIMFPGRGT